MGAPDKKTAVIGFLIRLFLCGGPPVQPSGNRFLGGKNEFINRKYQTNLF